MDKVFIVVERIAYEGDTVLRVFGAYKDAVAYADEMEKENIAPGMIDYDVYEREVY